MKRKTKKRKEKGEQKDLSCFQKRPPLALASLADAGTPGRQFSFLSSPILSPWTTLGLPSASHNPARAVAARSSPRHGVSLVASAVAQWRACPGWDTDEQTGWHTTDTRTYTGRHTDRQEGPFPAQQMKFAAVRASRTASCCYMLKECGLDGVQGAPPAAPGQRVQREADVHGGAPPAQPRHHLRTPRQRR